MPENCARSANSFGTGPMKKALHMSFYLPENAATGFFIVGSMTEKKRQGEQNMFYRARIVDPTGTFFVMAGSYQPEAMQQMARIEPPAFVAVIGKPTMYETQDGNVLVSIRAESVTIVDRETRDCWVLDTAAATLTRLEAPGTTADAMHAKEKYKIDPMAYRKMVYHALTQLKF